MKKSNQDFPGGPAVKNLLANAGDTGRKIPHAAGQLTLCTTTTEPMHLEPVLQTGDATAVRSLRTAMKTQNSLK